MQVRRAEHGWRAGSGSVGSSSSLSQLGMCVSRVSWEHLSHDVMQSNAAQRSGVWVCLRSRSSRRGRRKAIGRDAEERSSIIPWYRRLDFEAAIWVFAELSSNLFVSH
jgi:hypothetical protein